MPKLCCTINPYFKCGRCKHTFCKECSIGNMYLGQLCRSCKDKFVASVIIPALVASNA